MGRISPALESSSAITLILPEINLPQMEMLSVIAREQRLRLFPEGLGPCPPYFVDVCNNNGIV